MNLRTAACLFGAIGATGLLVIMLFAVAFLVGDFGQGETPGTAPGGESAVLATDEIPPVLAKVYNEVGNHQQIVVPPALIAAIAARECGLDHAKGTPVLLWKVATEEPATVQQWIDSNQDVDRRGCGYGNDFRVWGPMQFQDTTFGLSEGADVPNHPKPAPGSYGDQAGQLTKHRPPSMLNIRDAVYAAGIKLKQDSRVHQPFGWRQRKLPTKQNINEWQDRDVYWAAYHYQGDCRGGYCEWVLRYWNKWKEASAASAQTPIPTTGCPAGLIQAHQYVEKYPWSDGRARIRFYTGKDVWYNKQDDPLNECVDEELLSDVAKTLETLKLYALLSDLHRIKTSESRRFSRHLTGHALDIATLGPSASGQPAVTRKYPGKTDNPHALRFVQYLANNGWRPEGTKFRGSGGEDTSGGKAYIFGPVDDREGSLILNATDDPHADHIHLSIRR